MKNGVINLKTENLLSQVETVRADLNMNPLGVPESVTKAIADNMSQLSVYPDQIKGGHIRILRSKDRRHNRRR